MKNKLAIRIALYAVLGAGLIVSMVLFSRSFSRRGARDVTDAPATQVDGEPAVVAPGGAQSSTNLMIYLGLTLAFGVSLGVLAARDFSEFFGQQAIEYIFNDDGEGQHDADYEAAEMEVTNGNVLEAVRLMREYYRERPRAVFVALRIAELYETNLNNPLAAALEYEEVLKKKLPPERWGWAAIHLANLYSGKLGRTEEAMALLQRVVREFGSTAAAKKARRRLGLPEDGTGDTGPVLPEGFRAKDLADEHDAPASELAAADGESRLNSDVEATEASTALPAGFRPKGASAGHGGPASEIAEPLESPVRADEAEPQTKLPPGFRPKET